MGDVQDFKPGEMDISVQEQTFSGFVRFARRAVIVTAVFLILLAMWNA